MCIPQVFKHPDDLFLSFFLEAIRSHILQWSQEKNRRIADGYDFEV